MRIDMRSHPEIRKQVHDGLIALRLQGRQIWYEPGKPDMPGFGRLLLDEIVVRLMVGVGDLARLARDNVDEKKIVELKKELGNIIFSTVRWIDDLGLDVLECLDLAVDAQEKFANSGRPR
jgi:hypothetical protein